MSIVIGLISGTSVDGIDTALVEIQGREVDLQVKLLSGETYPYLDSLRQEILEVCAGKALSMAELARLDDAIAVQFAQAAQKIQVNQPVAELIGSHGQTVFHRPPHNGTELGYSLQLGRGSLIADLTVIDTISNFRAADIDARGHGAPLVSKIDACLLGHPTENRCIQNIGGISNVTYLPARDTQKGTGMKGWDIGPGNTLLDIAVQHLSQGTKNYDQNGDWAASGKPCQALVIQWLQEPYFQISPPKSTGRELFGWDYFQQCLTDAQEYHLSDADLLATLTELTVSAIAHSYRTFLPQMPDSVFLCGGGSHNLYLKDRLQAQLGKIPVMTTNEVGLNADYKEAISFAVLAYWRQLNIHGNLPEVTNARQPRLLGEVHLAIK
ncbi:anhydro-N-acetylmuramic acid kinase [Merismopedia glauca]|uniref:Anhydro-N-acetylmuramic acid kinase n=1 Tax=Merismopedia glauca CCAP 1448/3 TaxID=1296344 RepID=A0A2T1C9T9_9CYAN|nr:anhydro-N-acetylmuramic acid kinase [Merismopedia glauca]PSB05004.1 anhydro-N-acetylmuramic acid kinase [Merismopedia glauca CCAP 1448/3]